MSTVVTRDKAIPSALGQNGRNARCFSPAPQYPRNASVHLMHTGETDRQTDRQTPDRCFTLSATDAASVTNRMTTAQHVLRHVRVISV